MAAALTAANVTVDLSGLRLPGNLAAHYGALLDSAVDQMQSLEAGAIVNRDEGWQTGHYWLRNSSLAPVAYRDAIEGTITRIRQFAAETFRGRFSEVLWIGIGGSGLGPQMLYDALRVPNATPLLHFFDNTDPTGMQRTLAEVVHGAGFSKTLTVVVSKSGGTKETRNGMLIAQQEYGKAGLDFSQHAVAITKEGSELDKLAQERRWLARFPMWDWVGGRTSITSAVGILPARLMNADADAFLRGATEMDTATRVPGLDCNPALQLAAAWYHLAEKQRCRNMIVLPYCDQLTLLSKYLQQLVMESLGKDGYGLYVLGNKGSTDQHSFVQQLRDGCRDFFALFLRVLAPSTDWVVEPDITAGDYLAAFQEGTEQALADAGRLSARITIPRLNESTLGALVALFERAVGFYGAMLGINPYHQPGVEAGKKAADVILQLQARLVAHLKSSAGKTFTVAELAKACKGSTRQIQDTLERLVSVGAQPIGIRDGAFRWDG